MAYDNAEKQINLWEDFKHQITYVNRFQQQHELLDRVKSIISDNNIKIPEKTFLYRARIYDGEIEFIHEFEKTLKNNPELVEDEPKSEEDQLRKLAGELLVSIRKRDLDERIKSGFWGYNKIESFIPQNADVIKDGRANPARIKYLYVADQPNTALAEVRPLLKNYVSIAQLEVINELEIADLTYDIFNRINDNDRMLVYLIMDEFSKPNNNEPFDYIATQHLSEFIKKLGFDGVKYNSSLYGRGRNFVIFNYSKCEAISSKLYRLDDICYDAKCVGPVGFLSSKDDLYHWKLQPYKTKKEKD